ncbi:MAG: type II secretion system F family protein [Acidobacteriota bacterium]
MGLPTLIPLLTFLWVAIILAGSYYLFVVRPEAVAQDTLRQRIRTGALAVGARRGSLLKDVEHLSSIGPLQRLLSSDGAAAARLRQVIHQSGLKVNAGRVVLGSACLALVTYLVVTALWSRPFWNGALAGVLAGWAPYAVLKWLAARRLRKFEEQFPEAVSLLARTLRAGHAFTTGLRFAADELPEPVAGEFKLINNQQTFGLPIADGLRAFALRVPIIDARFFVTAVLTQMESGGNLAEVLDNLGRVIRERFQIKRQLRVLTAHGRMTGYVLAALPPALALYLYVMTPAHFKVLFEDPLGRQMLVVAVALQVFGAFLIHKLSDIEY